MLTGQLLIWAIPLAIAGVVAYLAYQREQRQKIRSGRARTAGSATIAGDAEQLLGDLAHLDLL